MFRYGGTEERGLMFRCTVGGLMFRCGYAAETNGGFNVQVRFWKGGGGFNVQSRHY
jgi:hypothetical protein